MKTAFGRAMLDSLNGQPQDFEMAIEGGPSMPQPCRDFLSCRQEEQQLLKSIRLPPNARVLDYGCGAGRYQSIIRTERTDIDCIGLEKCDLLRDHCAQTISQPSGFYATWNEIPKERRSFDLIILAGNGLGILGDESNAAPGLEKLVATLRLGGQMLIEAGNPFGGGYTAMKFTTAYRQWRDDPFVWGYADRGWVEKTLARLGCKISFTTSQAPMGCFFFAVATKDS